MVKEYVPQLIKLVQALPPDQVHSLSLPSLPPPLLFFRNPDGLPAISSPERLLLLRTRLSGRLGLLDHTIPAGMAS